MTMAGSEGERGKGDGGDPPSGGRFELFISALNHRERRRILRYLHASDEPHSSVQLARALSIPLSTASYHVRTLLQLSVLRKTGARQVRGAIETFYASTVEENTAIITLLEETRDRDESDRDSR